LGKKIVATRKVHQKIHVAVGALFTPGH